MIGLTFILHITVVISFKVIHCELSNDNGYSLQQFLKANDMDFPWNPYPIQQLTENIDRLGKVATPIPNSGILNQDEEVSQDYVLANTEVIIDENSKHHDHRKVTVSNLEAGRDISTTQTNRINKIDSIEFTQEPTTSIPTHRPDSDNGFLTSFISMMESLLITLMKIPLQTIGVLPWLLGISGRNFIPNSVTELKSYFVEKVKDPNFKTSITFNVASFKHLLQSSNDLLSNVEQLTIEKFMNVTLWEIDHFNELKFQMMSNKHKYSILYELWGCIENFLTLRRSLLSKELVHSRENHGYSPIGSIGESLLPVDSHFVLGSLGFGLFFVNILMDLTTRGERSFMSSDNAPLDNSDSPEIFDTVSEYHAPQGNDPLPRVDHKRILQLHFIANEVVNVFSLLKKGSQSRECLKLTACETLSARQNGREPVVRKLKMFLISFTGLYYGYSNVAAFIDELETQILAGQTINCDNQRVQCTSNKAARDLS